MTDTTIITGQYVRIDQTPANLGERLLARLIDAIIIGVYVFATYAIIINIPYSYYNEWMMYVLFFILYFPVLIYSLLFEVFNQGQTPGKKLMKIKVVMKDGSTPSLSGYLLRWLLYPIDVTFTSGLGVLFVLLTKNRQRIGDLAAGTMVIRLESYRKIHVSLDEYEHLQENYSPLYPQVTDLSYEQVEVIRKVLSTNQKKNDYAPQLSQKIKGFLHIDTRQNDRDFLETLVKDYEYYAYVEI